MRKLCSLSLTRRGTNYCKKYNFVEKVDFLGIYLEPLWKALCGLVCYVDKAIKMEEKKVQYR